MGSFVSKPLGRAVGGREVVQGAFDTLADIIAKFPNQAQNAKFLFVPGMFLFCCTLLCTKFASIIVYSLVTDYFEV